MTSRERRLEAPHRRADPGPRILEKSVVRAYRGAAWLFGHVPQGVARELVGAGGQLSYLAWPTKRHWSNANFGHVLGLPPDNPRVRRLALAAYRTYGRYVVELMRLPGLPPEEVGTLVADAELDELEPIWRESEGGLIFAVGHVGNNEAVAAGVAKRGWPINVVADDSSFPEMFELLRQQRESWGVKVIAWRNLRAIYSVLRRREMLALLVDWGYRPEGIPVKLFDAWTTLPAGPATLAAKTKSRILPVSIRRAATGAFKLSWGSPITVRSSDPAELVRATQAMADALQSTIAAAPEQWYSFKPMWPATAEESAELERRALAALAGTGPAVAATDGDAGLAATTDARGTERSSQLEPGTS
ncbi:MAG: lysophospholipid acyltransferase family protein [Chloroflexota bacterium]